MFGGSFDRRPAAVAGRLHPGQPDRLERAVSDYLGQTQAGPALAIVAPHAGYVYSGATAGRVYGQTTVPNRAVILCPNHSGRGALLSVWSKGVWELPIGKIAVDDAFAAALLQADERFEADTLAHLSEHAIEVQIPFLVARNPDVRVVPIVVGIRSVDVLCELGKVLASVIRAFDEPTLIVASNDMSHFVSAAAAKELDQLAIDRIEALDPRGLHRVVEERHISMCGVFPTTLALSAALDLGAKKAELIDYSHSGQVTGDNSSVVAYAGLVIR